MPAGQIAVVASINKRRKDSAREKDEDISEYDQSPSKELEKRQTVLHEEAAQKKMMQASRPGAKPKRVAKTMREEVASFTPFADQISRNAHLRKQQTVLAGSQVGSIGRVELTEAEMQSLGMQCSLSVEHVRLCWECFKACDRKAQGYVDFEELKLLLVILDHMEYTEEFEALAKQLKLDKNMAPDSISLKFPEFVELFQQACGGMASLAFRMAAIKQEANSVHKLMEEAANMDMMARRSSSSGKVVNVTIQMYGVPEVHIQEYLSRELREADACKQLPYAMCLFVLFVYGVGLHSRADQLFSIDSSIENDLRENANFAFEGILPLENGHIGSKGIDDVNNIPDFWSWLSAGLVPLLWIEAWDVSEAWGSTLARCTSVPDLLDGFGWDKRFEAVKNAAYSSAVPSNRTAYGGPVYRSDCPALQPPELPVEFYGVEKQGRGMYLYFNRVVGGLRLRQERRQKRSCPSEAYRETSASFGAPCFDSHYWLRPDLRSGIFTKDHLVDDSRTTYLRNGKSQAQIRQEIKQLEDERWLDPSVQKIELAFPSLNAEIGTLTVTYIHLFLPRSGHIHKTIDPVSVNLRAYNGWFNYVVDTIWAVMTFKLFLQEARELSSSMRRLGCRKGFSDYISFWNVIDWISVFFGFLIIGIWIAFLVMLQNMDELLLTSQASMNGGWETDAELDAFFEEVTSLLQYNMLLHQMFAGYVVVCVFRFFKAFNSQPRLSIVTRTLAAAAVDIAHFSISFFTVLLAFAFSGCILYGQELEDFEHFDRAIITCYRLLLGDFDFQALYDIDRYEAVAWFWSNSILLLLIMMNMLLAVIMDVYTEVKAAVVNDVTLFAQTKEVVMRWWRRWQGKEVSLSKVFEALDTVEMEAAGKNHRALDPTALMMIVPGLQEEQALEILEGANELLEEVEDNSQSISVGATAIRTQEMLKHQFISHRSLFHLLEMIAMLGDKMGVQQAQQSPISRQVSDDGGQILEALLEKVSPALVGAAVEQAFAKRVDPVFAELVKVRDDIATCVVQLGKDFERRFGALERHAENIWRELDFMKTGNHSRALPYSREPYYGVFVTREERLTRRTPTSTGAAPTPAGTTRTQRLLDSDREASTNSPWLVPGER